MRLAKVKFEARPRRSWRRPNAYDEKDEWERYVMAHAALLDAGSVYFPTGSVASYWKCPRCQHALAVARAVKDDPLGLHADYFYWCRRCNQHGCGNAYEFHKIKV